MEDILENLHSKRIVARTADRMRRTGRTSTESRATPVLSPTPCRRRIASPLGIMRHDPQELIVDLLISVCHYTAMDEDDQKGGTMERREYKVRRVVSRGTPSYQLGHYEMTGKPGSRRSVFKVLVHLGEFQTPEGALEAWRQDVERARSVGREKKAARVEAKIRKLEGARSSDRTEAR